MQSERGVKVHIDWFISISQVFSSTPNKDYLHYLMIINFQYLLNPIAMYLHNSGICITVLRLKKDELCI